MPSGRRLSATTFLIPEALLLRNLVLPLFVFVFLLGCQGNDPDLAGLQLKLVPLQGKMPVSVESGRNLPERWRAQQSVLAEYGYRSYAWLTYLAGTGDTIRVAILEFGDDISALGFILNGGYTRENLPVVRGNIQERSIRAGRRVFLISSSIFRPLNAEVADKYVQVFPGYRAGLPREFLALPIKHRMPGGTSLQMGSFLGTHTNFAMLVQRYEDQGRTWQCARSWNRVSAGDWEAFLATYAKHGIVRPTPYGHVLCEGYACAFAERLPDGRVVVAFGELDWNRLVQVFLMARRSMADSDQ